MSEGTRLTKYKNCIIGIHGVIMVASSPGNKMNVLHMIIIRDIVGVSRQLDCIRSMCYLVLYMEDHVIYAEIKFPLT